MGQKGKNKNRKRDKYGRFLSKKGPLGPRIPWTKDRTKPVPFTIQFMDKDDKLLEKNPLFKEIMGISSFIEDYPLEAARQLVVKDLAILTAISDGILKNALKEGEIFQGNKVNPLLKQQNYLAFQNAKRQTASTLLKITKLIEEQEEKAAAKRKKPKVMNDLDVLMS